MSENQCSHCGQTSKPERIDGRYIVREIEHVLHFERGILYTIKELLIRPGHNIRHFINENRSRLVKPILFIILTSLVYTLMGKFFHIEKGYINIQDAKGLATATMSVGEWINNHYGYANIVMGAFTSLWLKLFFRKYDYNFFEILILLCFVFGMGMLIFSAFTLLEGLMHIRLMQVSAIVGVAYVCWAVGQFFDGKKPINYLKVLISYLLGMATFGISVVVFIVLVEVVMRK